MQSKNLIKSMLVLLILATVFCYFYFELGSYLSFQSLKENQAKLQESFSQNPIKLSLQFALLYIFVTAFSIPGAAVLTLAAGAVFGLVYGTLIVSFASTIGATLAFLVSRFLLREFFENKFSQRLTPINEGIHKEGAFYLFTLRLIPAIPFFLINILM